MNIDECGMCEKSLIMTAVNSSHPLYLILLEKCFAVNQFVKTDVDFRKSEGNGSTNLGCWWGDSEQEMHIYIEMY